VAPAHVLDFLQHFTVFETKKGKTIKKVARYQQFEAVNDIVDRTLGLIGKPVNAQDRTGVCTENLNPAVVVMKSAQDGE
jgi:type I restriction enzyme, R subunit